MNTTENAEQVFGYSVTDGSGNKIGKVDNVWVDDATNELEFVGVKTGWFMGKTHVIPVANARIAEGSVQVPFDSEQIKNAPSFGGDDELSPEQEDEIYSYYGEGRSTDESPSGLPADSGADYGSGTSDYATASTDNGDNDDTMTLHEEELQVGKRQVDAGRVRLRKVVHTEHREVPVELRREDVEIERVPATGDAASGSAFQAEEIDVPLTREEAVVGTESHATEQVRLKRNVSSETENVGGDVRREDVETDDSGSEFTGRDRSY